MPDESMKVLAEGLAVQRNKIPDYAFYGLSECIDTWNVWYEKNLLPFPGSWQEQPAHIWDMLKCFDEVNAANEKDKADMAALQRGLKRH